MREAWRVWTHHSSFRISKDGVNNTVNSVWDGPK